MKTTRIGTVVIGLGALILAGCSGVFGPLDGALDAKGSNFRTNLGGYVSGASSVELYLSGSSIADTTTSASGNYSFAGLPDGTYYITPYRSGYTFSPQSALVTAGGGTQTSVDFAGIGSVSPPSGYIAFYPFAGNANDTSGNGYNGTVYGATPTSDRFGTPNSAYSFNGTSDYITTIPSASIPASITVGMWLDAASLANGPQIWGTINNPGGGKNGWWGQVATNGSVSMGRYYANTACSNGGVVTPTGLVSAGQWTYLTFTFADPTGAMAIYVNGVQGVSGTCTGLGTATANDNPLIVGIGLLLQTQYFLNGSIAEVRVYNSALTPSQVQTLYASGG